MYSAESAVFLSGGSSSMDQLPAPYAEHLPALIAPGPLTLRSAFNINTILRDMVAKLNGEQVPDDIAAVVRDSAVRTAADIDTAWGAGLVMNYFRASKPLGLNMQDESYVAVMADTLVARLEGDIPKGSLLFAHHRIHAVETTFNAIGVRFNGQHVDRISEGLYENFCDVIRTGREDLGGAIRDVDNMIRRVQLHLTLGR